MRTYLLFFATLISCHRADTWFEDEHFSWDLAVHEQPRRESTKILVQAVDVVQIFRGSDKIVDLPTLRKQDLVFETRDRGEIENLFAAVRDQIGTACEWRTGPVYYILAFDHTLQRFARIRVYGCQVNDMVSVRPIADVGGFSTRSLAKYLSSRVANFP